MDFQFDSAPTYPDRGQILTIRSGNGFDKIQHTFLIDDVKMLSQEGHSIIIKMDDGDRIVISFKDSNSFIASEIWNLLNRELKQHLFRPDGEEESESSSSSDNNNNNPASEDQKNSDQNEPKDNQNDSKDESEQDNGGKQLRRTIGTLFHLKK